MGTEQYIELQGYESEIVSALKESAMITETESREILYFMESNLNVLGSDETFERFRIEQPGNNFTTPKYQYYINIKIITLVALIYLLDYKVTGGLMGFISAAVGMKMQAIVRLNEEKGEKCILKELLRCRKRRGDKNLLKSFKGECCNNYLKCFYRRDGRCECGKEQVQEILRSFEERNIVKRQGWMYQVQL